MKHLFFFLLFLCANNAMAAPVGREQALQTAVRFMESHFPAASGATLRRAPVATAANGDEQPAYYVFNVGQGRGFVLVSGDDRTVPILGYADHGDFDLDELPDNMRSFLQEYTDAIRNLRAYGLPANVTEPSATTAEQSARRAAERTTIAPIVKTSYNQSAPYWNDTPVLQYGGRRNHAATGCVATAMAQVMAVYRHPARTKAEMPVYQFTFNGQSFDMPAIAADSAIHWELISDDYVQEYTGTPAEDAVAALMSLCGTAVQMSYGVNELGGSSTTAAMAADALVRYFDYEEQSVRLIRRNAYSYVTWENMIYDELQAGRPVIYSGLSSTTGHTFVCDGYDAENRLYHVNWGWGGTSDGYFSLLLLSPQSLGIGGGSDTSGYGMAQSAIIGIKPNDGVTVPQAQLLTANFLYTKDYVTALTRESAGDDFKGLSVCYEAWNWSGTANTFDLGLRIVDGEGNTVQDIPDPQAQGRTVMVNARWATARTAADYAVPVTISGSLPNGTYRIIATCRVTGTDEWLPDVNADSRFIEFYVGDERLVVSAMYKEPVFGLTLARDMEVKAVADAVAGKPHQVKAELRNDGTLFRDDVFYTLNETDPDSKNKKLVYAFFAELGEAGTNDYTFNFTPTVAGTNTLRLYANDNWGTPHLLGTQTVTVNGAPDIKLYVDNVDNYSTEQGAVVGNTLKMTFRLANEGSSDFTGRYDIFMSYSDDDGANWTDLQYTYPSRSTARIKWETTLKAGEAEEKTIEWSNLKFGRVHRFIFALYENAYYWPQNMLYTEEYRLVETAIAAGEPTDVNGDGVVNALDIQETINAAVLLSTDKLYDINSDGVVNALDIQEVIKAAATAGQ